MSWLTNLSSLSLVTNEYFKDPNPPTNPQTKEIRKFKDLEVDPTVEKYRDIDPRDLRNERIAKVVCFYITIFLALVAISGICVAAINSSDLLALSFGVGGAVGGGLSSIIMGIATLCIGKEKRRKEIETQFQKSNVKIVLSIGDLASLRNELNDFSFTHIVRAGILTKDHADQVKAILKRAEIIDQDLRECISKPKEQKQNYIDISTNTHIDIRKNEIIYLQKQWRELQQKIAPRLVELKA